MRRPPASGTGSGLFASVLAGSDSPELPENGDAIVLVRNATSVIASIGVRRGGRTLGTHNIRVDQAVDVEDFEVFQSLLIERYRRESSSG